MYVVDVMPIARGVLKDSLSYFSKNEFSEGSIVSVPIRGRKAHALVLRCAPVTERKSELRGASFSLQKITSEKSYSLLRPAFLRAIKNASHYFVGTEGALINTFTPKPFRETPEKFNPLHSWGEDKKPDVGYEKLLLQTDKDERFSTFRSVTRELFARKQSLFLLVPTIFEAEQCAASFERGIAPYTICLHGSLPKKELAARLKRATEETHPVLLVGTSQFLGVPRTDIQTIIIERESAGAYKERARPYADGRVIAEMYAREIGARCIFADTLLRVETLFAKDTGAAQEFGRLRFRPLSNTKDSIADMREQKVPIKGEYDPISEKLEDMVTRAREEQSHVFIWSGRRGLSPITVCSDCGEVVKDIAEGAPMVLHKTSEGNIFFSHRTGEVRSAGEACKSCGSWKLTALGAGSERMHERLSELFPDMQIFLVDSDHTKTSKQVRDTVSSFYEKPGSVLIGTEMALPYLSDAVAYSAVAGIDSLLSVPEYAIEEKVLGFLLTIRGFTQKEFLIQTRNPKQRIIEHLHHGTLLEFYREELDLRKRYHYPPFTLFIKLTAVGGPKAVEKVLTEVSEKLSEYDMQIFSAHIPMERNRVSGHAFIVLPKNEWPNKDLEEKLRSLPPQIAIAVSPSRLL